MRVSISADMMSRGRLRVEGGTMMWWVVVVEVVEVGSGCPPCDGYLARESASGQCFPVVICDGRRGRCGSWWTRWDNRERGRGTRGGKGSIQVRLAPAESLEALSVACQKPRTDEADESDSKDRAEQSRSVDREKILPSRSRVRARNAQECSSRTSEEGRNAPEGKKTFLASYVFVTQSAATRSLRQWSIAAVCRGFKRLRSGLIDSWGLSGPPVLSFGRVLA